MRPFSTLLAIMVCAISMTISIILLGRSDDRFVSLFTPLTLLPFQRVTTTLVRADYWILMDQNTSLPMRGVNSLKVGNAIDCHVIIWDLPHQS